jgi:excisionase family DNA binding protein
MTFGSAKNKDDDDAGSAQIQYGTSRAHGARIGGYLRVHQTTVYRLIREQKLPAFRVGSDWRFNREEIEWWMIHEQKRS